MASEEPVLEQKAAPKAKPELYKIHSLVRATETRNQRMKAAAHHRFVQRFGGGRITVRRARPATVTKALLMQYMAEIQKAVDEGKVVVKTMVGGVVDLKTFSTSPASAPSKPLPNPPLDSAAHDKTFEHGVGEKKELFEGGGVPGGAPPPLNVKPALMASDEKPIQTSGDPAKARAEAAKAEEGGKKDNEEELGDDEPTKPDVLEGQDPDDDTTPSGKRGKDKKSKKEGTK